MKYPFCMYERIFEEKFHKDLNTEENKYLTAFADSSTMSLSKKIFAYANFYIKRFYPLILIHLLIRIKVKSILKKSKAPENIQNLYKEISTFIILSAMCK